jgi:hypothetical protein
MLKIPPCNCYDIKRKVELLKFLSAMLEFSTRSKIADDTPSRFGFTMHNTKSQF